MLTTIMVTLVGFAILAGLKPTPRQVALAEEGWAENRAVDRLGA